MKQSYKIFSLLIVFICIMSLKALAIDDDGGIIDDVPLDGGLSLIIAAGVGYGVKKLSANRNKTIPKDK